MAFCVRLYGLVGAPRYLGVDDDVGCSQRAISAVVPIVPDPRHSTAPFHMEPGYVGGTTWGNLICWRMPPSATERYTSPLMQSIGEG